jgi:hypothetical protein
LRGGGGNFGIATALEYRLHPVGPMVLGGPLFWSIDDAPRVLRFLRDFAPEAPDELGISMSMMLAPPVPFMPLDRIGTPVIGLVLAWSGNPDDGMAALAPLRAVGTPIADVVRPIPYLFLQSMLDAGAPHGRHYYWKAHRLPTLSDETIDVACERAVSITSPFSQISGWAVGGAVSRVDPGSTAVGKREVGFELSLAAAWSPADPDGERHKAWVRQGWEALRPQSAGVYANFISDEGEAGVQAAYGDRMARLTALKDRYDPTNVFRHNANIRPSQPNGRPQGSDAR